MFWPGEFTRFDSISKMIAKSCGPHHGYKTPMWYYSLSQKIFRHLTFLATENLGVFIYIHRKSYGISCIFVELYSFKWWNIVS